MMKSVSIVGSGPAGLMAAYILVQKGYRVNVFDHKKTFSRKLLVAGNGGFNLTHSEPLEVLIGRYDNPVIQQAVSDFTNTDFRRFLRTIGVETYIGTSGRVFPLKGMTPAEVVKRWHDSIKGFGGKFFSEHHLSDIAGKTIYFETWKGVQRFQCDHIVLALGGASWSKTGSDGSWTEILEKQGVTLVPFEPSNGGVLLDPAFISAGWTGKALKNVGVYTSKEYRKGDLVFTDYGLEGSPIYAMNGSVRKKEDVFLDLKPDLDERQIKARWKSELLPTEQLRSLKLSREAIALLKRSLTRDEFLQPDAVISRIKKVHLKILGIREIEEAISTVGGISMDEVDETFKLKKINNTYAVGEMLDWDTCTGGYLIQAAVSMGFVAAMNIINSDPLSED